MLIFFDDNTHMVNVEKPLGMSIQYDGPKYMLIFKYIDAYTKEQTNYVKRGEEKDCRKFAKEIAMQIKMMDQQYIDTQFENTVLKG